MKSIPIALVLSAITPALGAAEISAQAPLVSVTADGRDIGLHEFKQGWFGMFELSKPADLVVTTAFDVRWVEIRPKSTGVVAMVGADHHSVTFHMTSVVPITVEFNRDLERVLHLFAYAPEKFPCTPGTPGVRYFGPGLHEAGIIDVHDNETVYLAPGAWVKGHVRAIGARNASILGRGVLDGSGTGPDGDAAVVGPGEGRGENMVYLDGTLGARIEGITIFDSPGAWTVYLTGTTGTRIDGVRILNPSQHYGDDGVDIVSSSDVVVENIFVRTNDDCVVIKNLRDVDTHDIVVRHAVLWNMPTGGNGIEIGFETRNKPIHGIRFEDVDIIHVERGAAISIHNGDAATVEDVEFKNIRVEDARRKLIDFAVIYAQYGADRPATSEENSRLMDLGGAWDGLLCYTPGEKPQRAKFRGHIRNIRVTDLHVVDGVLPYSVFAGFDGDHRVENVVIEGLQYQDRPIRSATEGRFSVENASVEIK